MTKQQAAATGGNGILSFWNVLFVVTMSGVGFAAGAAYGRHSVLVSPSSDAVQTSALPEGDDGPATIPDETFSAFDRIPDARGRRVAREGGTAPQVVLAPGAEQAVVGAPEGSAAAVEAPVAVAAAEPAPVEAKAAERVAAPVSVASQPKVSKQEQVFASAGSSVAAPVRRVGRAAPAEPSFEIVAAGARTWEEANEASRSLQDGGLKTTVSAIRDDRGSQRWLVHVQGSGDTSERKRQEQLIRRLLTSR